MARHYLTVFGIIIWFVGCQQSPPLERSAASSRDSGNADLIKEPKGDDEKEGEEYEEDSANLKKKKKKKPSKDGDDQAELDEDKDKDGGDEDDETPVYPQLGFNGKGYTTYELKDRLAMTMSIETRLDDSALTIVTKTAKVECGDKSGCKQKDVDSSVNANSIGANVYKRTTASELKQLKKDGFNTASYAIFAKSVRGKNGITYTFDKPIPVYPWPAAKSRYEALDDGPETWTTTATADRYIPLRNYISLEDANRNGEIHERSGNARKAFSITMVVSKEAGSNSGDVKLSFNLTITEDKDRIAYKYFPIPKTSTFTIDTSKRDVRGANMINWSHGDKSKKAEESVLDYKLCTKTTPDDVKQFPCE
jgi:hypothetical protein